MAMSDLTLEVIREKAEMMKTAESELTDAMNKVEDIIDWINEDMPGQNELVWVDSIQKVKVNLYDYCELVKQQSEKLETISKLFEV
ncbi:MAG: hypothetical protein KBS43_05635 [Oscillospiraceae bacterium]|nr:hypothetical protein [Candidatus Limimonas coprohippi]